MADYKENILKAKQRSNLVVITNELDQIPQIEFMEEIATIENGNHVVSKVPVGSVKESMTNPATTYPLVHPVTGASLGTSTYEEYYMRTYSLYLSLAKRRDDAA
jgi:hypothetical protein